MTFYTAANLTEKGYPSDDDIKKNFITLFRSERLKRNIVWVTLENGKTYNSNYPFSDKNNDSLHNLIISLKGIEEFIKNENKVGSNAILEKLAVSLSLEQIEQLFKIKKQKIKEINEELCNNE